MKIPTQAKKVFTGIIFDAYQWEQKLFDGSTTTFEKLKRPDTLLTIPIIGKKIMVSEQEQPGGDGPCYTFLGGRQNPNETALDGAQRELLEEGGLTSSDWQQYLSFTPHDKLEWSVIYFIARNCQKSQAQTPDAGEKIKLLEVNFDELIDLILGENFYGPDFALHIAKLKIRNRLDELRTLLFKK